MGRTAPCWSTNLYVLLSDGAVRDDRADEPQTNRLPGTNPQNTTVKPTFRALLLAGALTGPVLSQTLLFSDNFDNTDDDGGDFQLNSRTDFSGIAGVVPSTHDLESFAAQQLLSNDTLKLIKSGGASSGVRFGPQTDRYNWGDPSGATSPLILADDGLRIKLDYALSNLTNNNDYLSFSFGTANDDPTTEKLYDDGRYGLRFEGDRVLSFVDGADLSGPVDYAPALTLTPGAFAQIDIKLEFASFNTGETVNVSVSVEGIEFLNESFTLDATEDFRWEFGAYRYSSGTLFVDNLEVTTLVAGDSDNDDLPDAWELQWTDPPNLTDLDGTLFGSGPGAGTGDFDGDGLYDIDEYELSVGLSGLDPGSYPDIDPTEADTDGDTLSDFDEIDGFLGDPTLADTDGDELDDAEEDSLFLDPFDPDMDDDGGRDGFEVAQGTDPEDDTDFPIAAGVSVVSITDDASSDILASKVYTHKISGGGGATVNGVVFDVLDTSNSLSDFDWTPSDGNTRSAVTSPNLSGWTPADGGVTGTGIIDLLSTMSYSTDGGEPGESQTYTLSGLTPGEDYIIRLYIRSWTPGSNRPLDITFTNGAEVIQAFGAFPEDSPGYATGTFNDDDACYVSWSYTAQGTDLVIDAATHPSAGVSGKSFHMYGMTNEVDGAVTTPPLVTVIDNTGFISGDPIGSLIGTLSSTISGLPQAATYSFVSGTGDTDNGLFQIVGDQLQVGSDFTGANSVNGQVFSVRIQGDGGGEISEDVFELTVFKDDDLNGLNDAYVLLWEDAFDSDSSADWTGSDMLSNDVGTGAVVYEIDAGDSNTLQISNPTYTAGALQSAYAHNNESIGVGETVMLDIVNFSFPLQNETIGVLVSLANPPAGVAAGGGSARADIFTAGIRRGGDFRSERFEGTTDLGQGSGAPSDMKGVYITRISDTEFVGGYYDNTNLELIQLVTYTNPNFAGQPAYVGIYTDIRSSSYTAEVDNFRIIDASPLGPVVTGVTRNGSGDLIIDFEGSANTTYTVTKSADLSSGFGALAAPLSPTTDGSGIGQVTVPASEFAGASKYFVRIED